MAATPISGFPSIPNPPPDTYMFVLEDPNGIHLSRNYNITYGQLKLAFGGAGSIGPMGIPGMMGEDGLDGEIIPAIQGPQGIAGINGVIGKDGNPGFDGADGEDGLMIPAIPGPQGIQGIPGTNGTIGFNGNPGLDGIDGEDGFLIPAIPGPAGINGTVGKDGTIGPMGLDGSDGDDGFPIPGPQGVAGTAGTIGTTGPMGAVGLDGSDGEDGLVGPPGLQGNAGANGATGAGGPQGITFVPEENTTEESCYTPPNTPYIGTKYASPAVADQAITAATLTLITGSKITPANDTFSIGQIFTWRIAGTKTAAGTAANSFFIRIGTAGTTADGIVATFTTGLGTAVADNFMIEIVMVIRTLGAAATASAYCFITHNLQITGFLVIPNAVIPGTMAAFNSTVRAQFVTVSVTTGAAVAPTIQLCIPEVYTP